MGDIYPQRKQCTTLLAAKAGAKPNSCKPLLGRVPDAKDTDKPSNSVATGLNIERQVGKESCKVFSAKTPQFNIPAVNMILE